MNKIFKIILEAILIACGIIIFNAILLSYNNNSRIALMEKQVLEIGDTYCSKMASFDENVVDYTYTIKDGCEFIYK